MLRTRQPKYLLAVTALVLVFAGCKGESPTAPPSTTTIPPGTGNTTPPATVNIALTASNATPLVDSTSVITATVTQGTSPVPNGTAIEFKTTLGTFLEGNAQTVIRTTTAGVSTMTLSSSVAGIATITATVGNASKTITVTFSLKPVVPPDPQPPDFTPSITSVTPTIGPPAGGTIVTITGKNFQGPVRVLFDLGAGTTPKEAFVASVSPTQIQVVSPGIDLGAGQQVNATIVLINNVGTPNELRLTASTTFTYQNTVLTPKITTASPASGPIDGGTRVTIFGEGFQAPLQVFFGSAEAQVINVTYSQIIVMSPTARDTSPNGAGTITGPVEIRVININSATSVTYPAGFRYVAKMEITAAGPTEGPFLGGTTVRIDGNGFNDPVAVTVGGYAAQVLKVTGTQVTVITPAIEPAACGDIPGPIVVTNIDNGDSATGPTFTYRVPKPTVVSASGGTVGGNMSVTVLNAYGIPRLKLGDATLNITSAVTNGGVTTFTATVPTTMKLDTQACSGVTGITTPVPTQFDISYTSVTTGCTDTLAKGATISPRSAPALTLTPAAPTPFSVTFKPAVFGTAVPPAPAPLTSPASLTTAAAQPPIFIVNSGTAPMTITSFTTSCPAAYFTVTGPAAGTTLQTCDTAPVSISFSPPAPATTDLAYTGAKSTSCTFTITTADGATKTVPVSGTVQ